MPKAAEYDGQERTQAFVRRFDDRLWDFCCFRHRQHWGRAHSVPKQFRHDGEEGWWFPHVWVRDFADRYGDALRAPQRQQPSAAVREAQVAAAMRRPLGSGFPWLPAMQAWGLPPGTMFFANHTVRYPDGSEETFEDVKLRVGPRSRAVDPDQENLERMLEILHRKADAVPSEALVRKMTAKKTEEAA